VAGAALCFPLALSVHPSVTKLVSTNFENE